MFRLDTGHSMIVFLNGKFVPEERAVVSIFDRSFLYGDGLFETIRIYSRVPFRWRQHIERLARGAQFLNIAMPFSSDELRGHVEELLEANQFGDCTLRITLSRGVGVRGYSPKGADHPTLSMSLHPVPIIDPDHPPRWRLITSSLRVVANDPLSHHKTCNKLHQILARAEAESKGADEALLLNTDGEVAEAASSNLFWIDNETICTAPLASGILSGVTRAVVLELCGPLEMPAREVSIGLEYLKRMDGLFLTMSSLGIVEVNALDGEPVALSAITERIRLAYRDAVRKETG
jgi:aminodeoxychorismate lyase